ncbi:MAG: hypothetical protein JXB09_01210 [Deltaproteobacteria bacterium]|nr:hypothetical protein [Deltaproteobacteria bacterium]
MNHAVCLYEVSAVFGRFKIIKDKLLKKIVAFEVIAFLLIIMLFWFNELLDLPNKVLGAPVTPVNYAESILGTVAVLVLGIIVTHATHTLIKKIKFLEGIIPVCSFCKQIRVDQDWVNIDSYISDHSEADFSHSVCPSCSQKHYGVTLNSKESG